MKTLLLHLVCILASVCGCAVALAAPQPAGTSGVVTKVTDGDTLWFTPTGKAPMAVRLRDIDAPEICQEWGQQAQRALSDLALNKPATLHAYGRDRYGRTVGVVVVDETNLGRQMVEDGNAWSLRSRFDQGPLVKQERMAKALARGFHTQAGKVMPWDFRKSHGPCTDGQEGVSAARPAVPQVPTRTNASPPAPATAAFRCDGRTHCSHMRSCEEARFFLANCPGVRMDGNRDGVPCEKQWCRPGK